MQWFRRSFITGFFVTVPLVISIAAFVWIFQLIDSWTTPLVRRLLGQRTPEQLSQYLLPGVGIAVTAAAILLVGAVATNVIGRRFLQRGESVLLRVPVFRTIYAPVKELVAAFSPDNESGFKRVVLVEDARGLALGFVTKEFTVDRGGGAEPMLAVYVPTNHLYLGDLVVCPRDQATFPDISVEEGIRIFLTGGTALPSQLRGVRGGDRAKEFRV
jgi:uncharacterized membrane protein